MKKAANVVFIAAPNIGNLVPVVEFATQLTNTYPNLTATVLIITMNNRPLVDNFVDSRSTVNSGNVSFIHLPSIEPPSHDEYSIGFMSLLIENQKPNVKNALVDLMQTRSADSTNSVVPLAGLFVDMFCSSMIDVANELGVKSYVYFASPASFLGFMLHLPVLTQPSTKLDDSDTEMRIPGFVKPVPVSVLPTFFLTRNQDESCSWFSYNGNKYKEAKGIIVNTFQKLEDHALDSLSAEFSDLPVYPVGPVIDRRGPAGWKFNPAHEKVKMWLDQQPKASVVFLCFGSRGSLKPVQVKEIADGLEQSGHRFLWSVREPDSVLPEGFVDRTAGIGLVCGWLPQVMVLGHIAVGGFVSHCGWNSILESLWHGVPIATWPIYAEQQLNAFEMVKELKLSVEIRLDFRGGENDLVCKGEVAKGVKGLLELSDELRERISEMSEASKKAMMENGSSFVVLAQLVDQLLAGV